MITLQNTQRTYKLDSTKYKKIVAAMLHALAYDDFDIGIIFCSEKRMAEYNQSYRAKPGATDVLSFPFHEHLKAGERIIATSDDDKNLGDILLCPAIIDKKRLDWDRSLDEQIVILLAHGIAHLLGHDHETDEDYAQMQKVEDRLLVAAKTNT